MESLLRLHQEYEAFAIVLGQEIRHDVHIHRINIGHPEDEAWPAIVERRTNPTAVEGKAIMVATPRRSKEDKLNS